MANILVFVEEAGCVSGGVYQLEVPTAEVYKLEAAADRLRDFHETLRVVDTQNGGGGGNDRGGGGTAFVAGDDPNQHSRDNSSSSVPPRPLSVGSSARHRSTLFGRDNPTNRVARIAEALQGIERQGSVAPLTLTARRALFMARKLVLLRRAVIDFQHSQTEAVTPAMRTRMAEVLSSMRDTEGAPSVTV